MVVGKANVHPPSTNPTKMKTPGSVWNILGQATEGQLAGKKLTPVVHANPFWFSWGAFKPDTKIYQGAG